MILAGSWSFVFFKLHIYIGQDVLDLVVGVLLGNSTCM